MPPKVFLHLPRPLPEARTLPSRRAFGRVLERAGAHTGLVNLILADAAEVRRLNRQFLGRDRPTDVIAFDYMETPQEGSIWGDVFVSAEAALEQAQEREIPVGEELARLFLHGCLHLLGYRDRARSDRTRMRRTQESLLGVLFAPDRPALRGRSRSPNRR
jgi:probable rRNA maturation factor